MEIKDFEKLNLPETPGVYFFKKGSDILYIGRATSLRDRTRSYFSNDLIKTRGPLLIDMVTSADNIEFKETKSVLEAIILEANLIKQYQPNYNTKEKDNKSFNYIVITDEKFPRVLIERARNLEMLNTLKIKYSFGPYTNSTLLKSALKVVRKIIPFRDKCEPDQGKPCFSYQIGLCPGICIGEISASKYAENIDYLKMIFSGETESLREKITEKMNSLAKKEDFETAEIYKRKLFSLEHINDIALIKDDIDSRTSGFRIEAYDVSHLSGSNPVGVMTVVEDGEPNKREYRIFKIKGLNKDGGVNGNNDSANTYEIIKRRLKHSEWRMPDLIVVDGNIIERNSAEKALKEYSLNIPVVSVIKNEYHRPKAIEGGGSTLEIIKDKTLEKSVVLANSEAHRFSIRNQRLQRKVKRAIID